MDIDPNDLRQSAEEASESKSFLNATVAVTIAVIATFMGLCKVKDDNICQAMQQAQAKSIDQWSYYQASNTQAKDAYGFADQMKLTGLLASGEAKKFAQEREKFYRAEGKRHLEKKDSIKKEAEGAQADYDRLNYKDDQFDLSDALLAISISLLAVTSLTQKKFLFWIAMVPTVCGVVMGLAGLCGWSIHSDFLAKLLGT